MTRATLFLLSFILVLCSCSAGTETTEPTKRTPFVPPMMTETATESTEPDVEVPTPDYKGSIAPGAEMSSAEEVRVIMSFVGDCQPGSDFGTHKEGSYNWYADNYPPEYFFGGVQSVFATDDITVINCESVLTDNTELVPIPEEGNPGYRRYGPTSNAAAFTMGSVEVAGVANNHTGDYGNEGYTDTVKALIDAGLTVGEDMKPVYYEVKGVTVGILACNCWNAYHASLVRDQIAIMNEKSDVQVIFPHGGSMNTHIPDEWRKEAFRSFIDAGADIVAASHPRSLQPLEKYKDGVIAYSLGNFCYGGSTLPENASVILSATAVFLDGEYDRVEYEVIPCYLYTTSRNNYSPEIIHPSDTSYRRILEFMYGLCEAPVENPGYLSEQEP